MKKPNEARLRKEMEDLAQRVMGIKPQPKRSNMPPLEPALYSSPISLPAKKAGQFEIKKVTKAKGSELWIIGTRQAFARGIRPTKAVLAESRVVHALYENGNLWMTDLPEELEQIAQVLWHMMPEGRVLVGGLGLGILTSALLMRPWIDHVTTVEIEPDVIALAWEQFLGNERASIIRDDLASYLASDLHVKPYDCYLLDTWAGTGEMTWWSRVMPLRRTIRQRFGASPRIWCWAEDIMHGQIARSLALGNRSWYYKGLPKRMGERAIREFLEDVGLPSWEKKYGEAVNAALEEQREAA